MGARLKCYRETSGVTQSEMALVCGLSKNYISAIERGVNKCTAQTLIAYANKLNVSLDELVYGKTQETTVLPELQQQVEFLSETQQQELLQIIHFLFNSSFRK